MIKNKPWLAVGMSLIELMISVAILSILLAIAAPDMISLYRDSRLSSQSDLLVTSLNSARLEAIKQKQDVTLCPVDNANTATACSTASSNWSKGWIIMQGTTVLQRFVVQKDVVVSMLNTGVVFNSTLGSSTAAASFTLCSTGRKQQIITVSLSGHISKSISSTVCS
ncbi:GspH/FimT family pseudopilin [Deefgea sp. CFH1-16]|uniref:GspH/FimT family pseudopilin n=1 Tax=Deefgea sp. CFH1-16 TaxID=2675457 RepID=UPI0015F68FFD|nr:GspH/FimT family pseudopilin [Deefgea sp. CFH1-16]MBM5574231.1 prepilin-type N-terminal cleavage/methylation domain-containing protein [Deefgea sp. CFH1-16]